MKKLLVLVILIVSTTIVAHEFSRKLPGIELEQFTLQQKSKMMLKKMTLELDLNDAQKKEVIAFISDRITKEEAQKTEMKVMKEKGLEPINDERFAIHIEILDQQIANKKRMEKILNAK